MPLSYIHYVELDFVIEEILRQFYLSWESISLLSSLFWGMSRSINCSCVTAQKPTVAEETTESIGRLRPHKKSLILLLCKSPFPKYTRKSQRTVLVHYSIYFETDTLYLALSRYHLIHSYSALLLVTIVSPSNKMSQTFVMFFYLMFNCCRSGAKDSLNPSTANFDAE